MSKAASTFRKSDVKRAIQAAESAGMTVCRVEIDAAGKIILVPDNGGTDAAKPKPQTHWIIGSHPMRVRLKGINSIAEAARRRTLANVLVRMEGRTAAARRAGHAGVHREPITRPSRAR